METSLHPVKFNAVVTMPGANAIRLAPLEVHGAMTPDIAMTVIQPFLKAIGQRGGGSFFVFYNAEDEGLHPSRIRGLGASALYDNGEFLIDFVDLPLPDRTNRYDA